MSYDLNKLAEKYGKIFTLSFFGEKLVVVNDTDLVLEMIKDTQEGDRCPGRPDNLKTYVRLLVIKLVIKKTSN